MTVEFKNPTDEEIYQWADEFDIWLGSHDIAFIRFVMAKVLSK